MSAVLLHTVFYAVKTIVAFVFLSIASWYDIKSRLIPNTVWKYMLALLIPTNVIEFIFFRYNVSTMLFAITQFVFVTALAYTLYAVKAFGGADSKALIVLSASFPVYPKIGIFPLMGGSGIFALAVLANAASVAPFLMLYNFARNVASIGTKDLRKYTLYYFIGRRVRIDSIPKFHNLLEYIENDRIKRLKVGIEPTDEKLMELRRKGVEYVWTTPAIPFITYLTIGFVTALLLGSIVSIVAAFMGGII